MNQMNQPGRVNDRRLSALKRLEAQLSSGTKRNHGAVEPLSAEERTNISRQADTLALRIVPPPQARAIRTKKTEANGWSEDRQYRRRGKLTRNA